MKESPLLPLKKSLSLIGGGRMGRALVQGMLRAKVIQPAQVTVADPNADCRGWWQANVEGVTVTEENEQAVAAGEIVVLAVKPDQIEPIARAHARVLGERLIVSVAAGISLRQLAEASGAERVVRVMPNTPCLVGAGASAYCRAVGASDADAAAVQTMLSAVGDAVEVPESMMDAVTGLSGSGPAYVFLIIEALADGAVAAGLPRHIAMRLAAQTVQGAAKMVADTGEHPGALKDAVASPGGTTIAGLAVLEENGVRGTLIAAVRAAARRSRELGTGGN